MAGRIPSRGSDQFMLRFPEGMRDQIREEAERNGRSMNAEIIARLESSLARRPDDKDAYKFLLEEVRDERKYLIDLTNELSNQVGQIKRMIIDPRQKKSSDETGNS